jgi:hypothetical protein
LLNVPGGQKLKINILENLFTSMDGEFTGGSKSERTLGAPEGDF